MMSGLAVAGIRSIVPLLKRLHFRTRFNRQHRHRFDRILAIPVPVRIFLQHSAPRRIVLIDHIRTGSNRLLRLEVFIGVQIAAGNTETDLPAR